MKYLKKYKLFELNINKDDISNYHDYSRELISSKNEHDIQLLIDEYGIDHDFNGFTLLEHAIIKQSPLKIFKLLIIENGAKLSDTGYGDGNTPLLELSYRYWDDFLNWRAVVDLMIENGSDILYQNDDGKSFFDLIHPSCKTVTTDRYKERFPEKYREYLKNKNTKKFKI